MSETRNIIFLGASYAGISAAHYFLKHVYPRLPTSPTIKYQVILINASPKWYLRHASPRAIANTDLMPNEKIFIDIEPGFKQYGDKVKFIVGKATSWDPEKRVLFVSEPASKEIAISYHSLVLSTGSKSQSAVWYVNEGYNPIALSSFRTSVLASLSGKATNTDFEARPRANLMSEIMC